MNEPLDTVWCDMVAVDVTRQDAPEELNRAQVLGTGRSD